MLKRFPSLSRREAARLVKCALDEIADALSRGEESVKLHEFGTFFVRDRSSRADGEPPTGKGASRGRRRSLRFKPSHRLREKVEKGQTREPTNGS
ncbi:hypothetical protein B1812_14435 [Methylocystis bryophila]|uniref:Integration host factor subunit alpha n=1 Tax=Methylocystis bryophila TaxID=655015 RepID=A0A1W6N1N9_9HYPH|nr:hypothetical protein B1812_14435 [Methylocystis bryophila]